MLELTLPFLATDVEVVRVVVVVVVVVVVDVKVVLDFVGVRLVVATNKKTKIIIENLIILYSFISYF